MTPNTDYVTLSKLINHAVPQFHICKMGITIVTPLINMCKILRIVSDI